MTSSMQMSSRKVRGRDAGRKTLFWSLACLLCVTASSYVYFVNAAAWNAVRLGKSAAERSALEAVVSELEAGYLARKKSVTLSLAYRSGFEDARAVRFIGSKAVGIVSRNHDL